MVIFFVAILIMTFGIQLKKATTAKADNASSIQNPGANFLAYNKDIVSFAFYACFSGFAMLVGLATLFSAKHSGVPEEQSNPDYPWNYSLIYFFVLADLLHPTIALLVYPVVRICLDFKPMYKYAREFIT